jgi:signal transduction histidine kinase
MLAIALATVSALLVVALGLLWQLRLSLKKARLENERRAEFVAHTSHELRTPLNSIINIPEALLEMFEEEKVAVCERCQTRFALEANDTVDEGTECLECHGKGGLRTTVQPALKGDASRVVRGLSNLMASSRHMANLVNNVLDFSKIDAGKMELRREPMGTASLFDESRAMLTGLGEQKRVILDFQSTPGDVVVEADPVKTTQILVNLISNAIKFTPSGGRVMIRAKLQDGGCLLSVQDSGKGIAPEHHGEIFEPFRQVRGTTGGTGLGLPISRRLAELHGGKLWLESALGQGSTFYVWLPGARDPSSSQSQEARPLRAPVAAAAEPPRKG